MTRIRRIRRRRERRRKKEDKKEEEDKKKKLSVALGMVLRTSQCSI